MQMSPLATAPAPAPARSAEPARTTPELAGTSPKFTPTAVAVVEAPEAAPEAKPDTVEQALESINTSMKALGQNLEFSIDDESKRTVVKVIDRETQEVIRQMPSVEALEIAKALDRVQGLLIRQKA